MILGVFGLVGISCSLFLFSKRKNSGRLIVSLLVVMEKSLRPEANWAIIWFGSAVFIRKVLLLRIGKHSPAA
jgi:hypothetical protein